MASLLKNPGYMPDKISNRVNNRQYYFTTLYDKTIPKHIEISKLLDTLVTDKLDTKDLDLSSAFKKETYSCLMHLAPINPGLVIYSAERLRCFHIINARYGNGNFNKLFNKIMLKYLNYFVYHWTLVSSFRSHLDLKF